MVEFDTNKNGWDPSHLDNHVGINNNSIMNLSASWNYRTAHNPQEVSSLSYLIDLKMALLEWVIVGFSVATGVSTEQYILQWWEFNSTLKRDMETGGNISTNVKIVLGLVVPVAILIIAGIKGTRPGRFSYVDLVTSTNNFLEQRKLGEGGFGAAYRGEFLLVYGYMPNGSLDFHLFGNKAPLSWAVRYRISLGLVYAILYLHEEWEQCVVHRDIKSNNIMLYSSFNVKLGDFGLARLMDYELGPKTTALAATLGYLAPKYVNTDFEMGLVAWVWDLYGKGKLLSAVDEKLNNNVDEKKWIIEKPNLPTKMPIATYVAPTKLASPSDEPILTNTSLE
ncbi:hypothetical protein Goarm_017014, partial [Gossypium armourianum]|nr:hypothetical protein [Gossypium armourianum]